MILLEANPDDFFYQYTDLGIVLFFLIPIACIVLIILIFKWINK